MVLLDVDFLVARRLSKASLWIAFWYVADPCLPLSVHIWYVTRFYLTFCKTLSSFGSLFKLELISKFAFYQNWNPRFQGENFKKNKPLYFRLEKLAEKHGCTPAQLALAWILHQGDDVVPIPGEWLLLNLIRLQLHMCCAYLAHPFDCHGRTK